MKRQMLTAIPVRWLEDNRGWRVKTNLTHPRPLPGGEEAFGWVRRVCLDLFLGAFKVLTTSGSAAAPAALSGTLAGDKNSRWTFNVQRSTFNVQGLSQQNAQGIALPDSLSSLRSFAAIVLRNQRVVRVHSLQFCHRFTVARAFSCASFDGNDEFMIENLITRMQENP